MKTRFLATLVTAIVLALTSIGSARAQVTTPKAQAQLVGKNADMNSVLMPYKPRGYYGKRLEPVNHVVHGVGQQSLKAFANYQGALPSTAQPSLYMCYAGLKGLGNGDKLRKMLAEISGLKPAVIPQLGLAMTSDGNPETHYEHEVAAGKYDAEIKSLIAVLKEWNRPIYIRLGYEFNGFWNGYEKDSYKEAFRYVTKAIRDAGLDNVAIVWCFAVDSDEDTFMDWYPGDDVVDWWSIDIFSPWHFGRPETWAYLDTALARKFPVMIGESTPRRTSVQKGDSSWHLWFVPYFNVVREYPNLKATGYINWNWSETRWADWGDARVEAMPTPLKAKYLAEMQQPWWLHSNQESESFILKGELYKKPLPVLGKQEKAGKKRKK